jgi:hypothetical protein
MSKLFDLARMSSLTSGSGTITLNTPIQGCLSFVAAGVSDGDIVSYGIIENANSEVGRGVYGASGSTLTRTVLKSTNSGSHISLSGNAQVFITALAEDFGSMPVTVVTGSYIILSTDELIVCNSVNGFDVTIPSGTASGDHYMIKNINTGIITIKKSGNTIDGESTQQVRQWDAIELADYAINSWIII